MCAGYRPRVPFAMVRTSVKVMYAVSLTWGDSVASGGSVILISFHVHELVFARVGFRAFRHQSWLGK